MAQNGAAKVVGIDIDKRRIEFARLKLATVYQSLSSIVEFRLADERTDDKFDIVISKDSFEHYADPEAFMTTMKQYLEPDGIMLIGFGPLWKSPYGGHIGFMTTFPWTHLLFPESVILRERRRFRPNEKANKFERIRGGLNKMTFKRYSNIVRTSGLEVEYLKTNVSDRRAILIFNVLRRVPFCQEFFTQNVYSILRNVRGKDNR